MADIDTVLERLVTDAAFRARLGSDPATALAGYDLTADDLHLLASSLDDTDSGQRGVEQRTSKSAVLGLLASLSGGGGGGDDLRDAPRLDGASKDTAYLGDAAPDGESDAVTGYVKIEDIKGEASATGHAPDHAAEVRLPGKPKVGDITLTRSAGEAGGGGVDLDDAAPGGETEAAYTKFDHIKGESADDADQAAVVRKVSGQKKFNNIVLKRGADTSAAADDQLAPAESAADADFAFKQGWPVKWQGANEAPDGAGAPDAADADLAFKQGWPVKWQGASEAPDDAAFAPPAGDDPDGQKDFLTIEDA